MKITKKWRTVEIDGAPIRLRRTTGGVVEMAGRDDLDGARGMGFAHAHDRMVQMMMVRLAAEGRLSECLSDTPHTRRIDLFMRERGFAATAQRELAACRPDVRAFAEAYCAGVNHHLRSQPVPFELRLVRYRPEPWTVSDTLMVISVVSYIGLSQLQEDLERFLIEALRGGAPLPKLRHFFYPHLEGIDEEVLRALPAVRLHRPILPPEVRFLSVLPKLIASNNWAVAGHRSESGKPIQCHDPHLECNRLPPVWYEFVAHTQDDYRIGINTPGVPGLVMGRTRHLSMGFTYGFMDMVDFFVEDCRSGRFRKGSELRPFRRRFELLRPKKGHPIPLLFHENEHGTLEADPTRPDLEDGFYLCRSWTGQHGGAAQTLAVLHDLVRARTVPSAQRILRHVAVSANWVIADRDGNIGTQQSGSLPVRRHSGLFPVPGWDERYDWNGLVSPDRFASSLNPPEGFVATANHDVGDPGGPSAINFCMGRHRLDRITDLLSQKERYTAQDMERIQTDLYSKQAERYLELIDPWIPDCPAGKLLRAWDRRYTADSKGATVFEAFYHELLREVFGRRLLGLDAWEDLLARTNLIVGFYHRLDAAILGPDDLGTALPGTDDPEGVGRSGAGHCSPHAAWLGEEPEALLRGVLAAVLPKLDVRRIPRWGANRKVMMNNIFFEGRLPRRLRVDYGPIVLKGHRTTINQGSIFRSHGRLTTISPSYRFISDLATDSAQTALAGGPSGKAFSRYYRADLRRWIRDQYKLLHA